MSFSRNVRPLVIVLALGCPVDPLPSAIDPGGTSSTGAGSSTTAAVDDSSSSGPGESTESTGSVGTGSSGSTDGSTGQPPQPCEGQCLDVPVGWNGPVVALESDAGGPPPTCSLGYAQAVEWFEGVIAPQAECECNCGEAEGVTCPGGTFIRFSNSTCLAVAATYTVGPGCTDIAGGGFSYWQVTPLPPSGGSCDPQPSSTIVPAEFSSRWTICAALDVAPGTCEGDGTCSPPAAEGRACYWREGDVDCPTGDKQLVYAGAIEDSRGCSSCTCGAPAGDCTPPPIAIVPSVRANDDCGGSSYPLFQGVCTEVDASVNSVLFGGLIPETSCTASDVMGVGEAIPTGAVTMCCIE